MKRWMRNVARAAAVWLAVLCSAATSLPAQQAATATPAASASAPLLGPRLRPDYPQVEPAFPDTARTSRFTTTAAAGTTTITITTLALVLVVIIVVLLIAD